MNFLLFNSTPNKQKKDLNNEKENGEVSPNTEKKSLKKPSGESSALLAVFTMPN